MFQLLLMHLVLQALKHLDGYPLLLFWVLQHLSGTEETEVDPALQIYAHKCRTKAKDSYPSAPSCVPAPTVPDATSSHWCQPQGAPCAAGSPRAISAELLPRQAVPSTDFS